MASFEDRVATLEGQSDHHGRAIDALRIDIAQLRGEMATRRDLAELRGDMNRRFELIDSKIDRLFIWTVGLLMTGFFVIIGALVGVAFQLA